MTTVIKPRRRKLTRALAKECGLTVPELRELLLAAGCRVDPDSRFDREDVCRALAVGVRKWKRKLRRQQRVNPSASSQDTPAFPPDNIG